MQFSSFSWRAGREIVAAHREAVKILDHPAPSSDEEFELATSLYLLFRAEQRSAKRDQHGNGQIERATKILESLKQRYSNKPEYDVLLARCLLAQCRRRHPDGILDANQTEAINILESLVERAPGNPGYQFELGDVIRDIERTACQPRRNAPRSEAHLAMSESRLRRALEVTSDLESRYPNILRYYVLKKNLHECMAEVKREQAKFSDAEGEFNEAIAMQRLLIDSSETPSVHEFFLYHLYWDASVMLIEAGEYTRAREYLMQAADGLGNRVEQQDAHEPHDMRGSRDRHTLAGVYGSLSDVAAKMGNSEESQGWLRMAGLLEL